MICCTGPTKGEHNTLRTLPNLNSARLAYTQQQIDRVFRFETPDLLPFCFGVRPEAVDAARTRFADPHMVQQQLSAWGNVDRCIEESLAGIHWWNEQTLTPLQWPPSLYVSFPQETMLTAFGVPYELFDDGSIRVDWHVPIVRDLERDVCALEERRGGWVGRGLMPALLDKVKYAMDETGHGIPMSIPDWQSPLGLAAKLMGVTDFLYAVMEQPRAAKRLVEFCADLIIDTAAALEKACGGTALFRCGLWQPSGARGIIYDDLVSVINPQSYKDVAVPANDRVLEYLGGGEVHTCGPCEGPIIEALKSHQHMTSVDFFFVDRHRTRTTEQLRALKRQCRGEAVLNVMGMVFDAENFTPEFVREMQEGGGVVFSAVQGSQQQVSHWLRTIERAAE